jgi:hypothetical protein
MVAITRAATAAARMVHGREITVELVCAELGMDTNDPDALCVIENLAIVRWYDDHRIHNGRRYLGQYFQVDYGMLAACCREVLAPVGQPDPARVAAAIEAEYARATEVDYARVRAAAEAEYARVRAAAEAEYARVRAAAEAEYARVFA